MTVGQEIVSVHAGFLDEYNQSKNSMLTALQEVNTNNDPITATGHSMGAAIAQIAGMDLKLNQQKSIAKVITFGGTRVFYQKAAKLNDEKEPPTLRVVRKGDVITKISSKPFVHSYSHKVILGSGAHNPDLYLKAL